MTHVKLCQRRQGCGLPEGEEYLIVISHEVDCYGIWLPSHTKSFQTFSPLKEALRGIAANGGGMVLQASGEFDPSALELGLRRLTSEWGNL